MLRSFERRKLMESWKQQERQEDKIMGPIWKQQERQTPDPPARAGYSAARSLRRATALLESVRDDADRALLRLFADVEVREPDPSMRYSLVPGPCGELTPVEQLLLIPLMRGQISEVEVANDLRTASNFGNSDPWRIFLFYLPLFVESGLVRAEAKK